MLIRRLPLESVCWRTNAAGAEAIGATTPLLAAVEAEAAARRTTRDERNRGRHRSVGFVCGELACDTEFLHDREPVVRRHDPLVGGDHVAGRNQKPRRLLSGHPILAKGGPDSRRAADGRTFTDESYEARIRLPFSKLLL